MLENAFHIKDVLNDTEDTQKYLGNCWVLQWFYIYWR